MQLQLGDIASEGWRLEDVSLSFDLLASDQPGLQLEVASLTIGDYRVADLRLTCAAFELLPAAVDCPDGRLSLSSDAVSAKALPASFHYRFDTRELRVSLSALPLAGGRTDVQFHQADGQWQLKAQLAGTSPGGMADLLGKLGQAVPALGYQGSLSGRLQVSGNGAGLTRISWDVQLRDGGYSNAEGSQAAEALQLDSRGSARPLAAGWRVRSSLNARAGMLYAEPVYLEFSAARPLELSLDLDWLADRDELRVRSLTFNQPGVVTGRLAARLQPAADPPLRQLTVEIEKSSFPGLYDNWLQPWLAGTALDNLETEGGLHGKLVLVDGQPEDLQLTLDKLSFEAPSDQFGVQGLDGKLQWDRKGHVHTSTLAWQGANYNRLQLGAAQLALETDARSMKMRQPLVVPLLDGKLHVEEFELDWKDGKPGWLLDGFLTPVSMRAFSTALGWPELSGTLSGMVPRVRYEDGVLTLGGTLLVQAFDGDITLRNLRIEQPLGTVPRLWADARIVNLDLKTLTRTFSFGRIEGRLQGRVDGLYMEAWQPVAFDAEFATPEDDDSRHRISQKAVDNISNLGGSGLGGALSRSFLRFLEDFPYKRLGIRCRLQNGVCYMGGVAPAERGYYLVQGRWLPPRLDVIGFADEVDWAVLLDRLKSVTGGDG
ncbi:MAG TPA: hypothetical protein ENK49_12170, partial [Gammaproteobacteria bacterium]|nr:hypothetical protein [Gammaproteobacteria bacterium]